MQTIYIGDNERYQGKTSLSTDIYQAVLSLDKKSLNLQDDQPSLSGKLKRLESLQLNPKSKFTDLMIAKEMLKEMSTLLQSINPNSDSESESDLDYSRKLTALQQQFKNELKDFHDIPDWIDIHEPLDAIFQKHLKAVSNSSKLTLFEPGSKELINSLATSVSLRAITRDDSLDYDGKVHELMTRLENGYKFALKEFENTSHNPLINDLDKFLETNFHLHFDKTKQSFQFDTGNQELAKAYQRAYFD